MKKVALIILDGFGLNGKTPENNGISLATTPTFDQLFSLPYAQIRTDGKHVGLPEGQMGNSEVGHMTLGMGRIIKQSLVEIDELLETNTFKNIPAFQEGIAHVKENSSKLHLISLFSEGGVHTVQRHLEGVIQLLPKDIEVYLHLFTDGRDMPQKSALKMLQNFEKFLKNYPQVKISTLGGRYFGMDRDNNRERTQKAYDEIVFQQSQTSDTPSEYLAKSYEAEVSDEFLAPVSFVEGEPIEDDDAVFFLNYRTDRGRQLTQALEASIDKERIKEFPQRWPGCMTKQLNNIYLATMAKYYPEYQENVFLREKNVNNTLSEVLAKADLRQLHLAETEKYAHVTKFFNAEKNIVYDGQKNILVPSHKVATYDLDPEMSAQEIYDTFVENIKDFDFFIINFANGDMVGHTGVREAIIKTVEKLDELVAKILKLSREEDVDILLTADHGNCEDMGTVENPITSHTTNPVPFWYIQEGKVQDSIKATGELQDFAPTVLALFGIETPKEMTGKNLIK